MTVALDFVTLLCEEWGCGTTRDILASNLDPHLLKLLPKMCSYTDWSLLSQVEDAAVAFFRQFCWAHPNNSRRFAQVLLDALQPIGKYLVPVLVNFLIQTFSCSKSEHKVIERFHPSTANPAAAGTGKD